MDCHYPCFVYLERFVVNDCCDDCPYNVDDYCIMFDDILGFEDCVFRKSEKE